jgi:zinc protease
VAAQWHRLGVAGNVVLAVAGDFDPRKLVPQLRAMLAKLPRGDVAGPVSDRSHLPPAAAGDFLEQHPGEQAVVFQAFPGPGFLSEDFYTAEVADELFSGMSSRLFERVREEKGLAYFVRAARVTGVDTGMFYFYAGTAPGQEDAVLAEITGEIARVQAGDLAPGELGRCQTRLKAARVMGLQTNSSRAMQAGLGVLYGLPPNDWKNYDARIDAVTVTALREFAGRRLAHSRRVQLVIRP